MKRLQDSSTVQLLVVTLLGLPLVTPLLNLTRFPCTHDGHLHYHLVAALRYMWESGLPFARWLPDVAFGYGYPFFIFREGPPLYFVLLPHLLGLSLPGAFNLFYIACVLASGWFMFLWVRDVFGARSAFVSAVAYMAAPYILVDAFIRGNLPEFMALALFPLILWLGRRFILRGGAATFLAGTLALTLLALSHNISILLFSPFLLLYLLQSGWSGGMRWRTILIRSGLLLGLGLALSVFYTGPALLELDQITISQSVTSRNNDFHFNFANLGEILSPVQASDPSLLNPPLLFRLGWLPAILALFGLLGLKWAQTRERRGHIVFMALGAAALIFMTTPASLLFWENVPLIEYVQFPWRFIGRTALPLAFMAGVPFAYVPVHKTWQGKRIPLAPLVTVTAVTLLFIESFPNLYPRICSEDSFPTINTVHAYEHGTGFVGVDPEGSYFPKSVASRPDSSTLEADYLAGRWPNRFDQSNFPLDTIYLDPRYRPLSGQITIETPSPFTVRYLTFYYPGWRAFVDGQEVAISASDPEGLITFAVPAGKHTLEVSWHLTPGRAFATAISIAAALLILIVFIILLRGGKGGAVENPYQDKKDTSQAVQVAAAAAVAGKSKSWKNIDGLTLSLLAVAGLGLLLVKLLLVDSGSTLLYRESEPSVDYGSSIHAGELRLEGFNLSGEEVPAGGTFNIDLAWRALDHPRSNYQSNVWLVGSEGLIWSDKETQRPRSFEETIPTSHWRPGQWSWDSREVKVYDGTPPGLYEIVLILFDRDTLTPLSLQDQEYRVLGAEVRIGSIAVAVPDSPPAFEPQTGIETEISGIQLLGFNLDREEAAPGDSFLLTLFWEKGQDIGATADTVTLTLEDAAGVPVQQWKLPPVKVEFPPENWASGFPFRGQHLLRIDPKVEAGQYTMQLEGTDLAEMAISSLDRQFSPPDIEEEMSATFGDIATLAGVTVEPAGITLLWRALAETPTSYRVFVHLVDDSGEIVAQSDGIPAGWTRPTTGWLPGEYILDAHHLDTRKLSSNQDSYLRIGLYDPATGERLPTAAGDFVTIDRPAQGR